MRLALTAALSALALALAAPPALGQEPLAGPAGTSLNKVLVIGTDGTRWDLVQAAIKAGRAPNLARLSREGFGRPSLLRYGPVGSVFPRREQTEVRVCALLRSARQESSVSS